MRSLTLPFFIGVVLTTITIVLINLFSNATVLPADHILPDSGLYQGQTRNGLFHGQGRIHWPNGKYEGGFKDGLFHGQGHITWPDGSEYVGQFYEGSLHGQGKMTMRDGSSYEGEFTHDVMTGHGTYIYPGDDNSIYTGEMVNGLAQGEGELITAAYTYKGEFKDHLFHGTGEQRFEYGVYTGQFEKGSYHGKGKFVGNDGRVYEGEFVTGSMTGKGSYQDNDGNHYIGEFVDWSYEGKGELIDEDGNKYIGIFKYGSLDGDGEYIGADGEHYVGEFQYGNYEGQGTLTYAEPLDGVKTVTGIFDYGELIETNDIPNFKNSKDNNETVLYNQNALLEKTWNALAKNDPNQIDMYFLGVAGDGTQAVFRREINYVKALFDREFDTQGRSMTLINDQTTVETVPLATKTSITQSLTAIAEKMDANEDVLFIYLSSHGSKDFEFSLKQKNLSLPNLPAKEFANAIKNLPIKWKVIVVSACYSGGFIPYLEDDDTLIITAAADNRKSFGCDDKNNFTYFGEAYFADALSRTKDFIQAFDVAQEIVSNRERDNKYKNSKPQISTSKAIKEHLEKWRSQHNLSIRGKNARL